MALQYPLGLTSTDFSDGYTTAGYAPQFYLYGSHFTLAEGTVTQLGCKVASGNGAGHAIKIGLYTSGGVLLAQSTTSTVTTTTLTWADSGTISASVSAGTHYVLVSCASDQVRIGFDASGDGSSAAEEYSTAMPATETIIAGNETSQLYGVRLDFTADGGSPVGAGARRSLLGVG